MPSSTAGNAPPIGLIGTTLVKVLPDITEFGPILSRQLGQRSTVIAGAFGAALAAPFGLAAGAAIQFEDAFAAVRKTVDLSGPGFDQLESNIRQLATDIPVTAEELSRIAGIAGQLGITGVDQLTSFTETIARLGAAVDGISAEDAALQMARFINVTGRNFDEVDKLAAGLVDLGNQFAANEGEILHFSQLLAGAGSVIGLTQAEIFGLSTALASAGIAPERAGSSFSRLFLTIGEAADAGGEKLEVFAGVAQKTAAEFAQFVKASPAEAIQEFLRGFANIAEGSPAEAIAVLDALGLNTERVRDVLFRSSAAVEEMGRAIQVSTDGIADGTALIVESGKRFETTASRIQILRNTFNELGISVGEKLQPAINIFISVLTAALDIIREIPAPILTFGVVLAGVVGSVIAAGSAFLYAGQHLGKLFALFRLSRQLGGFVPLFKSFAVTITQAGSAAAVAGSNIATSFGQIGPATSGAINQLRNTGQIVGGPVRAGFTKLGNTIKGFLGGGGLFLLFAAAAVGVTLRMREVEKSAISTADAADQLATSLGLANETLKVMKQTSEGGVEIDARLTEGAEGAIRELRGLPQEFRRSFAIRLATELFYRGNSPEESIAAARQLFAQAHVPFPIGLELEGLEDFSEALVSQASDAAREVEDLLTGGFLGGGTFGLSFDNPLLAQLSSDAVQAQEQIQGVAQEIINLETAGQDQAAVDYWREFEEAVRDSGLGVNDQNKVIDLLSDTVLINAGIVDKATGNYINLSDAAGLIREKNLPGVFNQLHQSQGDWVAVTEEGAEVVEDTESALDSLDPALRETAQGFIDLGLAEEEAIAKAEEANEVFNRQRDAIISAAPLWGDYAGAVEVNVDDITDSLHDYIIDLNNWRLLVRSISGQVSSDTIEILETLSTGQKAALSELAETDPVEFQRILGHFEQFAADAADLATGPLEDITGTLADPALSEVFQSHMSDFFNFDPIAEQAEYEMERVRNAILGAIPEGGIGMDFSDVTAGIGVFPGKIADDATQGLHQGFERNISDSINRGLKNALAARTWAREASALGRGVSSGVGAGAARYPFVNDLVRMVQTGIREAKKKLGVKSPSTLTRDEIGIPLAQGIAEGIGSQASAVLEAFRSLVAPLEAEMSTAASRFNFPVVPTAVREAPAVTSGAQAAAGAQQTRNYFLSINNPTTHDLARDSERFLGVVRTTELMDL